MNFDLTDEQRLLQHSLSSFLADEYEFATRQEVVNSESGWRPELWKRIAQDLGLFCAPFSEEHGGFGGGAIENMLIMMEFGRWLVVEPYLGTVVIGGGFLKHSGDQHAAAHISQIIAGDMIIAPALVEAQARYNPNNVLTRAKHVEGGYVLDGQKAVVIGAQWATHIVLSARTCGAQFDRDGISIFLVDAGAEGLSRRDYRTIDGGRASEVSLDSVFVSADSLIGPLGGGGDLIEHVLDEATAALSAEACGVMERLLDMTIDYTKQRVQFRQPIASFQVIQHRLSSMFVEVEQAMAMAVASASCLASDVQTRARFVSAGKVRVGRAGKFVSQNAIQLHGAIGTTEEASVGHYFKRAAIIDSMFGSPDHHLGRFIGASREMRGA